MYKQMLCPRPIPRILLDKLTLWGYSILSSQRPTSFLGKKSENPQWSMIETWEFAYVDGISLKILWNFHCMIAIMGSRQIFKKTFKKKTWIYVFCAWSSTKFCQSSTCSRDRSRLYAPWAKSPDWGTAHRAFFERWELFKRAWSLEGRTQQNRRHVYYSLLFYFFSSRLLAYGNKSNSETLEFFDWILKKITDVQGHFLGGYIG